MKQQINAAAFIFLLKDNQFLAMRRENTGYMDGWLSLPSGHIEAGETPSEAAARELAEEVGITVPPTKLAYHHAQHYMDAETTYINHYFTCTDWSGSPSNAEPDKCSDIMWLNTEETHPELIEQVQIAQKSLDNQQIYSEYSPNNKKAL